MGKEKYATFDQKGLASDQSKGDVLGGVCLGICMEYIKHMKKDTSDSSATSFAGGQGSGLEESLLTTGDKGISAHYSYDDEKKEDHDYGNLWGKKNALEKLGFKVSVGKQTNGETALAVAEIKGSSRFAFHIIYFDVVLSVVKRAWHVVALKGNGWTGSFDRIFYAMDPNQGVWKITSTASLSTWIEDDIKSKYTILTMRIYTITT